VRKVVARNHQVLGVNQAVAAVVRQEAEAQFPPGERLTYRTIEPPIAEPKSRPMRLRSRGPSRPWPDLSCAEAEPRTCWIIERAHPDLGGWAWSGTRRAAASRTRWPSLPRRCGARCRGQFHLPVLMTDRDDLDSQIYKTFVGCGVADEQTPRAGSGKELQQLLKQNHRYVFSLIHKFNQDVKPDEPYSERDDIIVISDEAHRTQAGKLARNMRMALPNAAFIGFTGTPLFKHDQLTKRIFGGYVSRYDFKRSEEDGATVKLVYENRGEKLGWPSWT
jgi:type I restriction enzyme R subunit